MNPPDRQFPRQGEIYFASANETGDHFNIVVSDDRFNRSYTALCIPVTSRRVEQRSKQSSSILFRSGDYGCFSRDCVAQAEMIDRIPLEDLKTLSDRLSVDDLNRVLSALAEVFGITHWSDIEP